MEEVAMDNIQIANEIIDYIGENPVPFKSIDDICRDIIEKLQLQVDYDTLYQALEGIYNQATPSGGYTLQQFIDDGGKMSRSDFTQQSATELQNIDFSNANLIYMFQYATFDTDNELKLSGTNTTPQSLAYAFANLNGSVNIDLSDLRCAASAANHIFNSSTRVSTIDVTGIDTSQSTTFQNCFNNTPYLTWLDITGWNFSSATNVTSTFNIMTRCETLIGNHTIDEVTRVDNPIATCIGLNINMAINGCPELNRASLRAIINGLADRTGQAQRTLTLGSALIAKLTSDDIAIATGKGWYVQ